MRTRHQPSSPPTRRLSASPTSNSKPCHAASSPVTPNKHRREIDRQLTISEPWSLKERPGFTFSGGCRIMALCLHKYSCRGGCRCRGRSAAFCPRAGPSGCSSCRQPDAHAVYRPPPRQCQPSCQNHRIGLYR